MTENSLFSCSWDEYKQIEAVNHGRLKLMDLSPWHYHQYRESKPTKALEFGIWFHESLLEPKNFDSKYIVEPKYSSNGRTKEGKEERSRFAAENPGKIVLSEDDFLTLKSMRESVMTDQYGKRIFNGGQPEMTATWSDRETGIPCKGRIDWISDELPNVIVDLKTTNDANPNNLMKACYNYKYYTQAAFYLQAWETIQGKKADGFIFVFVEKPDDPQNTPLPPQIYELSKDFLNLGNQKIKEWLNKLNEIQKKNTEEYPHYTYGLSVLNLPAWVR